MALYLFNDYLRDLDAMRASRILDQHFGLGLTPDDFSTPLTIAPHRSLYRNYFRPWSIDTTDAGSTVHNDKDKFQVNLDVQQFTPEEIQVKVIENSVIIEGKHEEKQDEHGFISRQFTRRYLLPKGCEMTNVASSLSSDGVLTITAPKVAAIESKEKIIPITHTGPHKAVKDAEKKDDK